MKPKPMEVRNGLSGYANVSEPDLEKVFQTVLEEMLLLYFPPFRAANPDELLEQSIVGIRAYVHDLAEFDVEALSKGWAAVRRAHKTERWPTINAIRHECHGYAPARSRKAIRVSDEESERLAKESLAEDFMTSEHGLQAARECWALALKEWVQGKGREPTATDLDAIKRAADSKHDLAATGFEHVNGQAITEPTLRASLRRVYIAMQQRNVDYCRSILEANGEDARHINMPPIPPAIEGGDDDRTSGLSLGGTRYMKADRTAFEACGAIPATTDHVPEGAPEGPEPPPIEDEQSEQVGAV